LIITKEQDKSKQKYNLLLCFALLPINYGRASQRQAAELVPAKLKAEKL
jgi:hypothetical protein